MLAFPENGELLYEVHLPLRRKVRRLYRQVRRGRAKEKAGKGGPGLRNLKRGISGCSLNRCWEAVTSS